MKRDSTESEKNTASSHPRTWIVTGDQLKHHCEIHHFLTSGMETLYTDLDIEIASLISRILRMATLDTDIDIGCSSRYAQFFLNLNVETLDAGMDTGSSSSHARNLPEELVGMIMARFPFPAILKARCLSKSWLLRLTEESALIKTSQRNVASGSGSHLSKDWHFKMSMELDWIQCFQKQVASVSGRWPKFCPAFLAEIAPDTAYIMGYDNITGSWSRFKIHSCLATYIHYVCPVVADYSVPRRLPSAIRLGGALLCKIYSLESTNALHHNRQRYKVLVANVVTGCCRFLPPPPACHPPAGSVLGDWSEDQGVFHVGSDQDSTYKVFLANISLGEKEAVDETLVAAFCLRIQYYDSETANWSDSYTFLDSLITGADEYRIHLEACSPLRDSCLYLLLFIADVLESDGGEEEEDFENTAIQGQQDDLFTHNRLTCVEYNISTRQTREYEIHVEDELLRAYGNLMNVDHKRSAENLGSPIKYFEILGSSIHVSGSRIIVILVSSHVNEELELPKNNSLELHSGVCELLFRLYTCDLDYREGKVDEVESPGLHMVDNDFIFHTLGPPVPEMLSAFEVLLLRKHRASALRFCSDEKYLYICLRTSASRIVTYSYSIYEEIWSSVPCPRELLQDFESEGTTFESFAPGLQTFKL